MTFEAPPLGLYVHLPWCVRKCPYCDFNSHTAPDALPEDRYIDALLADLELDIKTTGERPIESVFFGGGTPSLFSGQAIDRFISGMRRLVPVAADAEITLEANPGTVEHGRFSEYREAGVNRVSLGAQSFRSSQLKLLGRIHDTDDIGRAVNELREAGIANFNLDLMYGLPEQSVEEALEDVSRAISLAPTHISHYELTLEPGTVFYHRPPPLPDDELSWEMQVQSQAALAAAGYEQYEVSAYALAGRRCRHNLNYWEFGDYIGVGAGAHGKLTDVKTGAIQRTVRKKMPRDYLESSPEERVSAQPTVGAPEVAFEFMLNTLRLPAGFRLEQFESRTGLSATEIEKKLRAAAGRGLLMSADGDLWRPTSLGMRFLNDLQELFLPP
jgi:putative oxygen-independent coproporphyrinogen III oxidase